MIISNQNKVLFIRLASYFGESNAHPENCMMPIEMAIMVTMASNAGIEFEIIDTEAEDVSPASLAEKIKSFNPTLIVLKSKSPSKQFVCDFFNQFQDIKVIGYGHAFTTNSEYYLKKLTNLQIVIHKEPELPFSELITCFKTGQDWKQIKGISFKDISGKIIHNSDSELVKDLDQLPMASYSHFIGRNYFSYYPTSFFTKKKMAFAMSSRGCPMKCTFCSPTLRQSFEPTMRYQSNNRIVEEFKALKKLNVNIVHFRDDILTLDKQRTLSLCKALKESQTGMRWMGQTHINCIDTEMLDAMKDAGCISLGFGIESGSIKIQKIVKKFNDLNHTKKIFKHCKKIGIKTVAFFQVGSPTETYEDVELTRDLLKELSPNLIQVALFTPYAGSTYYESLIDKNPDFKETDFHHYNRSNHNPSQIADKDLIPLQKSLYKTFIFNPRNFALLILDILTNFPLNTHIYFNLYFKSFKYLFIKKNV